MAWVECLHTVLPMKTVYRHAMYRGKCTGQPKYQRHWEGCCFAIVQNSGTSMGSGFSFFLSFALEEQVHHWQFGAFIHGIWAGWPGWFWIDQFTVLWQWARHALWLPLVGQLMGYASFACGTGVGLLLPPFSTAFSLSSCFKLWLMDNRKYQCRAQLWPSPSMGHTTDTDKFG